MTGHPMPFVVRACLRPLLAAVLLPLLFAGLTIQPVRAATVTVTVTMNDANSPSGNSDVIHFLPGCAVSGMAPCSLRDAVIFANGHSGAADTTTITLPAGTYTLTIPGRNESLGTMGDLNLNGNGNVLIVGAGAGTTIVQASSIGSAAGIDRVFQVGTLGTPTATISGMTIRYGNAAAADGGGIAVTQSGSTLTLNDCVVADNVTAGTSSGGGMFVSDGATLVLNRTTIRNNTSFVGGGISDPGILTVTNSTFAGNAASYLGGGILIAKTGAATVTNSTFTGNTAVSAGGGIDNASGTLTVTNSTFSRNSGNGITNNAIPGGTLTAINTLIAGNTAGSLGGGPDAAGIFAAGSKNVSVQG